MALDFKVKDIIHKIMAWFVPAYLPEAKKPYYLRSAFMPPLDIHEIASKAEVYNIETDPRVIEEGFTAATQLIFYLVADGYKIVTDLCHASARLRGEYDGTETGLAEGVRPEVLMQPGPDFKGYVREKAQVQIVGVYRGEGLIAEAIDEWDGSVNTTMTSGNVLHLRGSGLKIEGDAAHAGQVGLFFDDGTNPPIKAKVIAVNEPKTVKVVIPDDLSQGKSFFLKIVTQSSTKSARHILKEVREVRSEFKLKFLRRPGTFTEGSGEAGNGGGSPAGQDANPAQA